MDTDRQTDRQTDRPIFIIIINHLTERVVGAI